MIFYHDNMYISPASISAVVAGGNCLPPTPKKIGLSKKIIQRMQNLEPESPILGELRGKIKTFSTHSLYCRKFAAVSREIATSLPARPIPVVSIVSLVRVCCVCAVVCCLVGIINDDDDDSCKSVTASEKHMTCSYHHHQFIIIITAWPKQ